MAQRAMCKEIQKHKPLSLLILNSQYAIRDSQWVYGMANRELRNGAICLDEGRENNYFHRRLTRMGTDKSR